VVLRSPPQELRHIAENRLKRLRTPQSGPTTPDRAGSVSPGAIPDGETWARHRERINNRPGSNSPPSDYFSPRARLAGYGPLSSTPQPASKNHESWMARRFGKASSILMQQRVLDEVWGRGHQGSPFSRLI